MAQTKNQAAASTAALRVRRDEIDDVRSYMFEEIETKEVLHIDRLGADDIARAIEKLAVGARQMWVWIGEGELTLKLSEHWRVKIMRDGAVMIKVTDFMLVADSNFLLLHVDNDGYWRVAAKGKEITWDGTEEYFSPSDLRRLATSLARQILEQTRWL